METSRRDIAQMAVRKDPREEVSSLTVCTESTLLTAVIEAEERREVATCNIPNVFIQTKIEE
jgi:hypothetical protein